MWEGGRTRRAWHSKCSKAKAFSPQPLFVATADASTHTRPDVCFLHRQSQQSGRLMPKKSLRATFTKITAACSICVSGAGAGRQAGRQTFPAWLLSPFPVVRSIYSSMILEVYVRGSSHVGYHTSLAASLARSPLLGEGGGRLITQVLVYLGPGKGSSVECGYGMVWFGMALRPRGEKKLAETRSWASEIPM